MNIIFVESLHNLRGNSKAINNASFIRGAAQKLVKKELSNVKDDALINEISNTISELKEYDRDNAYMLTTDSHFQKELLDIEISYKEMVEEIYRYRHTNNPQRLYQLSESFFDESNKLVYYAQKYSEEKVKILDYLRPILYVSITSVTLIYLYQTYSINILEHTKDKIELLAYTDSLTKLPNRTYLDKIIQKYKQMSFLPTLACIFIDLNNLKITNDVLGHDKGDKLLQDFSKIIRSLSSESDLIVRNGGDEFVGIFEDYTENDIEIFKKNLYKQIEIYNNEENMKLSVAMGVSYSNIDANTIEELISIADQRMYEDKKRKS